MTKKDLQMVARYESLLMKYRNFLTDDEMQDFLETWDYFNERTTQYGCAIEKTKAKIKEKRKTNPDYARPASEHRKRK